jgi:Relaxase/Mobilisation nuclease domain
MVAMSENSKNVRQTLLYNEQKLDQHQARFLGAFNYWQEDNQLTFDDKLDRLQQLSVLNERSQAKTVHLSLNFHPDDELTDKKMRQIAAEFMHKIDFADQPALVYRHLDAGHPHMHVVTTNIRPDGSRITSDLRSPRHLMEICVGLEIHHHLTPAIPDPSTALRRTVHRPTVALNPAQRDMPGPQLLQYGQSPTKTGIARVLDYVLDKYIYTSLEELNAVLSLYRVRADRGSEQGVMYRNRGLYYRMIDENGMKIGAPIKASAFEKKPTLRYLERQFIINHAKEQKNLQKIRAAIAWSLAGDVPSLGAWKEELLNEGIHVVMPLRTGQGFHYISKNAVYRDVDLGPHYTAAAILERTGLDKAIESLALSKQLTLTPKDRRLLQKPDPADRLHLLLRLSPQHDHLQAAKEAETQELRQTQRQSPRLRL